MQKSHVALMLATVYDVGPTLNATQYNENLIKCENVKWSTLRDKARDNMCVSGGIEGATRYYSQDKARQGVLTINSAYSRR